MGNEDDGFPFVAETAQHVEERVSLLWRQNGGRFVQNENLRAAVERLEDLHALLESDRQLGDDGVERHSERVVAGELFEFPPRAGESAREQRATLDTEDDVFEHREILHEHEMLVNHADARKDRVLRRAEIDAATMHVNLAGVGPVKSVDDIHQRRLARTVFTDEPVDTAGRDGKAQGPVGVDGAETLVDGAQLEGGSYGFFNHG